MHERVAVRKVTRQRISLPVHPHMTPGDQRTPVGKTKNCLGIPLSFADKGIVLFARQYLSSRDTPAI